MASAIVELWARRIEEGDKGIDDVPAQLRDDVIAQLIEDGYPVSE